MPFKVQPPLYSIWQGIKRRCYNPRSKQFGDYGGRGIKVCNEWRHSYATFERDMSPRPPGTTIKRIDNDGDYSPENCRWATRKEQMWNLRNNRYVVVEGKSYLAVELAQQCGVKTDTIVNRAQRGLPLSKVLSPDLIPNVDMAQIARAVSAHKKKAREKTHCKKGHELTPENTFLTKQGWRRCRQCHNAYVKTWYARKRR